MQKHLFITLPLKKYILMAAIAAIFVILLNIAIFARFGENVLEGKRIIIDPGHGGIDSGTSDKSTFFEKDINLQISLKLQKELEYIKAAPSLTRSTDIALDNQNNLSPSRHKRDLLARTALFDSGKYDLFLSIHVNRATNNRAVGPIVLYWSNNPRSVILAKCIQHSLNEHAEINVSKNAVHKPVKYDYFILKNSKTSGVIIETGFISNPMEKKLLKDELYQEKLVKAIVRGLEDYYQKSGNPQDPYDIDDDSPININNEVFLSIASLLRRSFKVELFSR